ncbi:MAG: hypothetical protein ACYC99_08170 [Candidatus Geothermincolia bacterium]
MSGTLNRLKGQQGFSMAEVVVAVVLFVASVLGVSVMLVSGGQNVSRGAKDSTSANLAQKKVEEVKGLPWYVPWAGTPKDIDDFYFNRSFSNAEQFTHPYVIEDYGSIPGYTNYRRTTTIQYQYVTNGSTTAAVMNSNWVPSYPYGAQIDRPKGGTIASDLNTLHAMIIEVTVSYKDANGNDKPFTFRGLAGDSMITGGTNRPALVISSIDPTSGTYGNTAFDLSVYVDADGLTTSSTVKVALWRAGYSDIPSVTAAVQSGATRIVARFDLTDHPSAPAYIVRPGIWNVAVYWTDRGFDAKLRNCFTVIAPPPILTSIDSFEWGYRAQVSRRVTLRGTGLANPTNVQMTGQGPWAGYVCPGSVYASSTTWAQVDFNLTTLPAGCNDTRWNLEVTTVGGSDVSNGDAERVRINPPPRVTGITAWPGSSYTGTKVGNTLSGIGISGTYLQSLPTPPTVYIFLDPSGVGNPNSATIYQACSGGSVSADGSSDTGLSMNVAVNPMSFLRMAGGTPTNDEIAPSGSSPNRYGRYYACLVNADGQTSWQEGGYCNAYRDITHKQYTISYSSYQNTVGNTRFGYPNGGGGTYWQDSAVPAMGATASNGYAGFREWLEGGTVVSGANPMPSFNATADRTLKCRYYQYLYYNGTQVIGWICPAYTDSPYEASISTASDGYNWIRLYGKYSFLNLGACSASTTAVDLTNCTAVGVYWRQTDKDRIVLDIRDQSGGNIDSGTILCDRDTGGPWGPQWEGFTIPAGHRIANRYIRLHASNTTWDTDWSRLWTAYLYVE